MLFLVSQMSFVLIDIAKVRKFLADSKKNARYLSELLRQAWCFATNRGIRGCGCRKGHKKSSPRWSLVLGYDDCYDSESVPSMLLEMKGFIDINDIHKSGSENRPLTHALLN